MIKTLTYTILILSTTQIFLSLPKSKCTITGFKNITLPKDSKLQKFHFSQTQSKHNFDPINLTALEICYFQCSSKSSKQNCDKIFLKSMLHSCKSDQSCKHTALANKKCLSKLKHSEICLKEKSSCVQLRTRTSVKEFDCSRFENFESNFCFLNNGKVGPCERNGDVRPLCVEIGDCDLDEKVFDLGFKTTSLVFGKLKSDQFFTSDLLRMKFVMSGYFYLAAVMGKGVMMNRDRECDGRYFRFYDADFKAYVPLSCNLGN